MLVPFNLWLPELLSTPNCSASRRCLPAMAESGWMTLQNIRMLGFFWHSSQGAGYVCGICSGHFSDPGEAVGKVSAGSVHPLSLGSLSLTTVQLQAVYPCLNRHHSLSVHQKGSQFLVTVICWTIKASRWECLWKMLLSYLKSWYLLGAPHKSQLAAHCRVLRWQFT